MKKKLARNILAGILCAAGISWYQPCVWAEAAQPEDADNDAATAEKEKNTELELTEEEKAALASAGYEGIALLADSGISTYSIPEGSMTGDSSIAIGSSSSAKGSVSIAIGASSNTGTGGEQAIAIGYASQAPSKNVIAIGTQSRASNENSVSIGYFSKTYADNASAFGAASKVDNSNSVAIGYNSYSNTDNTVSFGDVTGRGTGSAQLYRNLEGIEDIAINGGIDFTDGHSGTLAQGEIKGVTSINGLEINKEGSVYGSGSIAIGTDSYAEGENSIAIGSDNGYAYGDGVTAIGSGTSAEANYSTAIGRESMVSSVGVGAVAIGYQSYANTANTVSFGDVTGGGFGTDKIYRNLEGIEDIAINGGIDFTDGSSGELAQGEIKGVTSINGLEINKEGSATGADSIAIGNGSSSAGLRAVAIGKASDASGQMATAIGTASVALNYGTVAIGGSAKANETQDIAIGLRATTAAGGNGHSIAIGYYAEAGNYGIALGDSSIAQVSNTIALGASAKADAENAAAIGYKSYSSVANTVSFGDVTGALNSDTPVYRNLEGIEDIAINGGIDFTGEHSGELAQGEIKGVTKLNGIGIDGSNNLTSVGTVNGVTMTTNGSVAEGSTDVVTGGVLYSENEKIKTAYGEADTALKSEITTAYGEADTALKSEITTAYGEADTALKNEITAAYKKVDEELDGKITDVSGRVNTAEDTIDALKKNTKGISYNEGTGTTVGSVTFKDGAVNNVTSINGITFSGDSLSNVGKVNGITLSADGISGFASGDIANGDDKAVTAAAVREYVDRAIAGGDVDLSDIEGINRDGEITTIETNTKISKDGIETNKITANSAQLGGISFKEGTASGITQLNTIAVDGNKLSNVASVNGITFANNSGSIVVGGIDITEMRQDVDNLMNGADGGSTGGGSVSTENTVGIKHEGIYGKDSSATIIEDNTRVTKDGVTVTGYVNANSLQQNGTDISEIYAAKNDVYTKDKVYTKTQVDDKVTVINTALSQKVDKTTFDGVKTTVDAIDAKTADIKVSGGVTEVSGVKFSNGSMETGNVITSTVNGISVSVNSTQDNLVIGGLDLGSIKDYGSDITLIKNNYNDLLDAIKNNNGNISIDGLTNVGGILRKDVDAEGNGTTVIEKNTSISKEGLVTNNITATSGLIGGASFDAAGNVTTGGTFNGAHISGNYFNGIDISALKNDVTSLTGRVESLENNGGSGSGGSADNPDTAGIKRPNAGETVIEDNTTITNEGIVTDKVEAGSINVGKGTENAVAVDGNGVTVGSSGTNQVVIDKDGITVGKNGGTVISGEDGILTDKGIYVGSSVDNSNFSVNSSGQISNSTGSYGFSTDSKGAHFTTENPGSYGPNGKYTETTIAGNVVSTGQLNADELVINGNTIKFDGATVGKQDFIDNNLEETDADGNTFNNHFGTSGINGTTQTHTKTDADGNIQSTSVNTSYDGMTVTGSTTKVDSDGNKVTETNKTTMTGGSISVDTEVKYTETGDDGKETEKTTASNVTIGNGDVKLDRVDENGNHSQMYVGEEIDKINSNMQDMGNAINKLGGEIDEVGALSAALAGLHPQPENANSRADFAMAMGSYDGEQALAVGGFYRPDKRTMVSVGASTTSSKHMFNMGVSFALDKMPEEKREALELKKMVANNEAMAGILERLEKLEADNQAMRADNEKMRFENEKMRLRYNALSADYEELKGKYGIKNVTAEEMHAKAKKAVPANIERKNAPAVKRIVVIEKDNAVKAQGKDAAKVKKEGKKDKKALEKVTKSDAKAEKIAKDK